MTAEFPKTHRCWFRSAALFILALSGTPVLLAQSEQALKEFFEGSVVEIRVSMPATKDGIDLYPERPTPIEASDYSRRLKQHGVSLQPGDRVPVTLIKAKGKHIEFQIAGGGYGVAGDETGYVEIPTVPKTRREKDLEDLIKNETDKKKRKRLEDERDELRHAREREERLLRSIADRERAEKLARIQEVALQSGSRFNIRYDRDLTSEDLYPEPVMTALAEYLSFNPSENPPEETGSSSGPGERPTSIRKGLLKGDVTALFGPPRQCTGGREGNLQTEHCFFFTDDAQMEVLFAEGVVVRFSIMSR